MLNINIERIWLNSRLILTMTTIIIYRFFVDVQIHLCKFYVKFKKKKKKKVLVVTKYDHASTVLQEINNNNVRVIITNETNKITFFSIQPISSANQCLNSVWPQWTPKLINHSPTNTKSRLWGNSRNRNTQNITSHGS